MEATSYPFKLGDFECVALCDGFVDYPIENFFANAPKEQVEEELLRRSLPIDFITTPYDHLFVHTGEKRVLVDMGAGNLMPNTGRLITNMKAAGIDPVEIDAVLITHAHPDHIGGCLDEEDNPIFSNARYYIWEEEWNFWFSEKAWEMTSEFFVTLARDKLAPVREKVTLLDREAEIFTGIGVIAAPGHTPGHMVVNVSSRGQKLLYTADTVLYPLHLEHPDWLPIYDILPEQAAASKGRIFNLAAEEKVMIMGQHFPPFPSLGCVIKNGDGWLWQPVEIF